MTSLSLFREWAKRPEDLRKIPEAALHFGVSVRQINRACDANRIQRYFVVADEEKLSACSIPVVSLKAVKDYLSEKRMPKLSAPFARSGEASGL